jgi:hypothetical protein
MKYLVSLLTFVLIATAPLAAHGDVDVSPSKLRPKLFIKAERRHIGHTARPAHDLRRNPQILKFHCVADRTDPGDRCAMQGSEQRAPVDPGAELTEGDIAEAVREIGLPSLRVRIQPGDETLVNIATIFYTRPQPFERSIDLLGFDIDLVASPVSYRWVHDDGTASTTSRPGRPYPAMDVTHRYRAPADDVHPRVDVTYRVRYRVDGGGWQTLGQTLQASGPAADLDVREAAPVLTKP